MIKLPQPICATSDAAAEKPKYTPTHAAPAPSSARTSGATIAGNVLPTEAKVCCPNIAASATSIGDSVFRLAALSADFSKLMRIPDDRSARPEPDLKEQMSAGLCKTVISGFDP